MTAEELHCGSNTPHPAHTYTEFKKGTYGTLEPFKYDCPGTTEN